MKAVIRIAVLLLTMLFIIAGQAMGEGVSRSDDFLYQMIYNDVEQDLKAQGYTDYEIIIDENYNVTVNINDSDPAATPAAEEPAQEAQESVPPAEEKEPEVVLGSEEEYALGIQELEQENTTEAMQHFLRALPNEEAEKMITDNASDYVDELMFAEEYETAQAFMMEHPFEGSEQLLAECNDHCFLLDLARGLNERWSIANQDTSTMADQKQREYLQECVACETQHLDKYLTLGFSDSQLADYAFTYIGALQSQATGAAYYGTDSEKYNENFIDYGYNVRARIIYLINRKYGIDIDSKYTATFKQAIEEGRATDQIYATKAMFTEQFTNADPSFTIKSEHGAKRAEMEPFQIINTSGYPLIQYQVFLVLLDENKKEIPHPYGNNNIYLFSFNTSELPDGKPLEWYSANWFSTPFSGYYYKCEFTVIKNNFWSEYTCDVYPTVQYAFDGTNLVRNDGKGEGINLVTSFALEEVKAYWTVKGGYFVPSVECILRNNGTADLKEAVIQCVFIDKDKNMEWSREKYYAVSSSDLPLTSGRGRSVIIYSTMGYEKKTRKVPDLEAEIDVNGQAVTKIDVKKP